MVYRLLLLVSLSCFQSVIGKEDSLRIYDADGLVQFSNYVSRGSKYEGETVYLENNIDMSENNDQFEPIGKDSNNYFCGVFDGQGYAISNLSITISNSQYAGLFGYSKGLTIRNVILDESCSITGEYTSSFPPISPEKFYVGGIIGHCEAAEGECNIENNVNMANVTFKGKIEVIDSAYLYLGGIVGRLDHNDKNDCTVKNCANYGHLIHNEKGDYSYFGGIAGLSSSVSTEKSAKTGSGKKDDEHRVFIQNCLNYGSITHAQSETSYFCIGGITGESNSNVIVENCVSSGKITGVPSSYGSVGSIIGNAYKPTTIKQCYWTSMTGQDNATGSMSSSEATVTEAVKYDSVNGRLLEYLMAYTNDNAGCNKWVLNTDDKAVSVSFIINNEQRFSANSKIFILPNLVTGEREFDGWYKNDFLTDTFGNNKVSSDTTLYGMFCADSGYTVTFDANGGNDISEECITIKCNGTYGELPKAERYEHKFIGWFTEKDSGTKIEQGSRVTIFKDHTLYAHWIINNYTVTFVFGNGTDPEVRVLDFDSPIEYPESVNKTGYTFNGWDNNKNITNVPNHSLTITAQWIPNNYTVTFELNGGDNFTDEDDNNATTVTRTVTFDSEYGELPEAERYEASFDVWTTEATGTGDNITNTTKVTISNDHTLHAQWIINKYTITFDFDNGEENELKEFEYNSAIEYPKNVTKIGYILLSGWSENITTMPNYNLTIKALWVKSTSLWDFLTPTVIMGITVFMCVVVIAVVILIIFVLKHTGRGKGFGEKRLEMDKPLIDKNAPSSEYRRIVAMTKEEVEGSVSVRVPSSVLTRLYAKDYVRPTMEKALAEADLAEKRVKMICSACNGEVKIIADEGRLFDGFTEEDAAAIAMYTYDFGAKDFECNPYRIINKSLVERSYANLQKASGLLYLVMTALRKLPRFTGKTLYRGVRSEVNLDEHHYHNGNVVTWSALSSTSPDVETTKAFLANGSKSGNTMGTLFIIDNGWGYDVQPYSLFPDEAEILLEPERQFVVVSVLSLSEVTIINLKMLDTPLILPEVFGDEW